MTVQLPPTVPARSAASRGSRKNGKPSDFRAYREAVGNARSAMGYDSTSPIWGKTTLEVLQETNTKIGTLVSLIKNPAPELQAVIDLVQELLKRELADTTGREAYRNR